MLTKIQERLGDFDNKKQTQITIGLLVLTLLAIGFFAYRFNKTANRLSTKMASINKARKETRDLLADEKIVQEQKMRVEEILEQGKNFVLEKYFQEDLLEKLGLTKNLDKSPAISKNALEGVRISEYEEIQLSALLKGLNMRQITELLSMIEQSPRVYTKSIEINRSQETNPVVDLQITIGTLLKKTETATS